VIFGGIALRFILVYAGQQKPLVPRTELTEEESMNLNNTLPTLLEFLLGRFGLGLVLLASFVIMGRGLGASGAFTTAVATVVHQVARRMQKTALLLRVFGDGTHSPLKDWLVFEFLESLSADSFRAYLPID